MQHDTIRLVALLALAGAGAKAADAPQAPTLFVNQTPRPVAVLDTFLRAVSPIAANDVWAVGGDVEADGPGIFIHFDGTSWQLVGQRLPDTDLLDVSSIASADVWAVGYLAPAMSGTRQTVAEHWNGQAWSVVPTPSIPGAISTEFNCVAALSDTNVWAAGSYNTSTQIVPLFEQWNGASWTRFTPSFVGPVVNKLAAISPTDIWAVGAYLGVAGQAPFAAHWNGTAWTAVTVPELAGAGATLEGVAAIATNNVWAVGWSTLPRVGGESGANPQQTLIEHWDGTSWSIVASPNIDNTSAAQTDRLFGVAAVSASDVWAVGNFEFPDGSDDIFGGLALHWDGTAWSIAPIVDAGTHTFYFGIATLAPSSLWAVGSGASPGNLSGAGPLLAFTPGG